MGKELRDIAVGLAEAAEMKPSGGQLYPKERAKRAVAIAKHIEDLTIESPLASFGLGAALVHMDQGYHVRRKDTNWSIHMQPDGKICYHDGGAYTANNDHLTAEDWEVLDDTED